MSRPRGPRLRRWGAGPAPACVALVGVLVLGACGAGSDAAPSPGWEARNAPTEAEFRGLDAPEADVVWAVGSGGTWAATSDGGASWRTGVIPGADSLFLVGVHAADAATAHVLGTHFDGGLARVYRTDDGGATWTGTFQDDRPGAFYDGMAFLDARPGVPARGVIFGDAIEGRMTVATTDDGETWRFADSVPAALEGEGGFAASGRAVTTAAKHHAWIGTGVAATARVLRSDDGGRTWEAHDTPMPAGPTSGIFGIAFRDTLHGVAVGGNYQDTVSTARNVIRTRDGGASWSLLSRTDPGGVRYGVAWAERPPGVGGAGGDGGGPLPALVAVGPSGTGISYDGGETWTAVDTLGYNTVDFTGRAGWAAGVDGRVARWRWE